MEELVKLLLPELLVDNFNITKVEKEEESGILRIFLAEKSETPKELSHLKLHSKGFFDEITIRDFPIRHYKVFLHIKRRKWKNLENNKNVWIFQLKECDQKLGIGSKRHSTNNRVCRFFKRIQ
ncbi:MAG: hypothetical protein ACI8UX_001412 [Psychromonas sp.]